MTPPVSATAFSSITSTRSFLCLAVVGAQHAAPEFGSQPSTRAFRCLNSTPGSFPFQPSSSSPTLPHKTASRTPQQSADSSTPARPRFPANARPSRRSFVPKSPPQSQILSPFDVLLLTPSRGESTTLRVVHLTAAPNGLIGEEYSDFPPAVQRERQCQLDRQ
jgi:hypothetical protein